MSDGSDAWRQLTHRAWGEGLRHQITELAMARWIHTDQAGLNLRPLRVYMPAPRPVCRGECGMVLGNAQHVIIAEDLPTASLRVEDNRRRLTPPAIPLERSQLQCPGEQCVRIRHHDAPSPEQWLLIEPLMHARLPYQGRPDG